MVREFVYKTTEKTSADRLSKYLAKLGLSFANMWLRSVNHRPRCRMLLWRTTRNPSRIGLNSVGGCLRPMNVIVSMSLFILVCLDLRFCNLCPNSNNRYQVVSEVSISPCVCLSVNFVTFWSLQGAVLIFGGMYSYLLNQVLSNNDQTTHRDIFYSQLHIVYILIRGKLFSFINTKM